MSNAVGRIDDIFWEAGQLAPGEPRDAYLARACGDDHALRQRVERLLQVRPKVEGFLERPFAGPGLLPTVDAPSAEGPGTEVGPYKLLEQIGEGGMGLVFMAEQTRPVRRHVALKVLKPGLDTRQVVARFEAERQALALMDHPHIAKVFDAGTTANGRPYFVMELVRGVPITDFCDQRRLTTRQRLELFVLVCQAVQHAHQKGIIHRDLKPGNVLVTLHDTVAVPKVIDFGIAKATAGPLTERTLFTHFAQMVGTPLYMSPEQAEMNGLDVDTRSDVYSLGVLLYELLTGTTPFTGETLRRAGLDEMRRLIREQEPPTPSQRLHTLEAQAATTVAARRGVDGRRLGQVLRGELDWVVMRALEKDRNRRYESASAFAADVQRYLSDETVAACPPSAGYRLRKYVRRHRRALATVGVIAGALLAATTVSIWQAARATEAQHQAEADRKQAEADRDRARSAEVEAQAAKRRATEEAAVARAVSKFLQDDLLRQAGSAPREDMESKGTPNLTVREALDRASAKVAERFGDQPVVEAAIQEAIGEAYQSLGDDRLAATHLERALNVRRIHLGQDDPETLHAMQRLADAYTWVGQYSDAIGLRERLLESAKTRLGADDPELLEQVTALAVAYRRAGDWRKARRILEPVVEQEKALHGPTVAGASESARLLAVLYQDAGMYKESAARLDQVLSLRKRLGADPDATLPITGGRILAYQLAGRFDEADRLLRRQLEFWRKRQDSWGEIGQARALEVLSVNLLLQNRPAEAEPLAREALALREKNHTSEGEWRHPYVMNVLGGILLAQRRYAEAEPLLVQGYQGMKQAEATMIAPWRFRLTEAGERVVRYYEETRQPEKAREWRERLPATKSNK